MGDRVQVYFPETGVYLYSHWNGDDIIGDVFRALNKKWRWSDAEYLARIVFDEMVGDAQMGELSYGIGTRQHSDVTRVVEVDTKNQKIRLIKGVPENMMKWWEEHSEKTGEETPEFIRLAKPIWDGTFAEFIADPPHTFYGEY